MATEKTQTGDRPDLRNAVIPGTEKFIAGLIFPPMRVKLKSTYESYAALPPLDTAAQRKRGSAAITETELAGSKILYTVESIEKRFSIPYSEVENYGGIEAADNAGGMGAKLKVMEEIEKDAAAALLNGASDTIAVTDMIKAVKAAKKKIKHYAGKTCLALSETAYDAVCTYPEVRAAIKRFTSVQPADNAQILALKKTILAMVFEVDEIFIGDDTYWAATLTTGSVNLAERAAVFKLTDSGEVSHKLFPSFAKDAVYYPYDDTPYKISSFAHDDDKKNKYDAELWHQIVVFNKGACAILTGITEQAETVSESGKENTEQTGT